MHLNPCNTSFIKKEIFGHLGNLITSEKIKEYTLLFRWEVFVKIKLNASSYRNPSVIGLLREGIQSV